MDTTPLSDSPVDSTAMLNTDSDASSLPEMSTTDGTTTVESIFVEKKEGIIELDASEGLQDEEATKQAALEALERGEKTPNEDKILAELDAELAAFAETHKNRIGGSLEPELMASIEEYIAEMKEAAAKQPPVKLQEDPRKYERSAGNDPLFEAVPVYDPDKPQYRDIAATIQRHIDKAEKAEKPKKSIADDPLMLPPKFRNIATLVKQKLSQQAEAE